MQGLFEQNQDVDDHQVGLTSNNQEMAAKEASLVKSILATIWRILTWHKEAIIDHDEVDDDDLASEDMGLNWLLLELEDIQHLMPEEDQERIDHCSKDEETEEIEWDFEQNEAEPDHDAENRDQVEMSDNTEQDTIIDILKQMMKHEEHQNEEDGQREEPNHERLVFSHERLVFSQETN